VGGSAGVVRPARTGIHGSAEGRIEGVVASASARLNL